MYMLEGKHCATPLQEGAQMMGYKTRRGGPDRPVLVSNSTTYGLPPLVGSPFLSHLVAAEAMGDLSQRCLCHRSFAAVSS